MSRWVGQWDRIVVVGVDDFFSLSLSHTHTHYIYIYIYIYNVPMIDNWHFFVKYLFILKSKVQQFQILFPKFQQLKNSYAKYTLCCVFVI
jgi:hypothetical protein